MPLFTGNFGITDDLKRLAAEDLKRCRLSREQVALGLSGQVGRRITWAQVDAWVAESKAHHFPLDILPAWVRVTGSVSLLEFLCNETGYLLADETSARFAELGRRVIERERAADREARLKVLLAEKI